MFCVEGTPGQWVAAMLLNHLRQTPDGWDDAVSSLCPDCSSLLTPRRGPVVRWHWAHKAASHSSSHAGCLTCETEWHLRWKAAYLSFDGWEVEWPVDCSGTSYRADAANPRTGRVREFVHSLSDRYVAKHLALQSSGYDVLWVFDGEEFSASRKKQVSRGGVKHLLKPRARWMHGRIGGFVHWEDSLRKHWKNDVWFPAEGETVDRLLSLFGSAETPTDFGVS